MARTTSAAVILILGKDYDIVNNPDITGYIDTASAVVTRVIACAARKGITISTTEAELIERWFAAYLYTQMDPGYKSRHTLRSGGEFNRDPNAFLTGAKAVDPSGCLDNAMKNNRVRAFWLGKPVSDQIDYDDRN